MAHCNTIDEVGTAKRQERHVEQLIGAALRHLENLGGVIAKHSAHQVSGELIMACWDRRMRREYALAAHLLDIFKCCGPEGVFFA
jgi:hypothetical protein